MPAPIYTIEYCDKYLDELLDKMGSDYFPLDVKFGRFVSMTYDFIREYTSYMEATQEVSDDLKPLIIRNYFVMTPTSEQGVWEVAEPIDYVRLISLEPFAMVGENEVKKFKKVYINKEGQRLVYERDPFRKPSPIYPQVFRIGNLFEVRVGNDLDTYSRARLSYVKHPTFGDINDDDAILVNLPAIAMEKILLKTAESLRFTTADETASSIYQFDQTFGKRNK